MRGKVVCVAIGLAAAIVAVLLSRRTHWDLSDSVHTPVRKALCADDPVCAEALDETAALFIASEETADKKETESVNWTKAEQEAEERAISRFAAETDRWLRPASVTESDAREFVREFDNVPPGRKMQCLHRALNLIPDANVLLLAGILFDRRQPRKVVRAVFDDVVNRSEEVKTPILKRIVKDRFHPCSDDAAWIFKVTGESPR